MNDILVWVMNFFHDCLLGWSIGLLLAPIFEEKRHGTPKRWFWKRIGWLKYAEILGGILEHSIFSSHLLYIPCQKVNRLYVLLLGFSAGRMLKSPTWGVLEVAKMQRFGARSDHWVSHDDAQQHRSRVARKGTIYLVPHFSCMFVNQSNFGWWTFCWWTFGRCNSYRSDFVANWIKLVSFQGKSRPKIWSISPQAGGLAS